MAHIVGHVLYIITTDI